MLKQSKQIKLIKNFTMQHSIARMPNSQITDKDIFSMFSGLFSFMQTYVKNQAEKNIDQNKQSYNYLLKLYLNAVKNMNKYKNLYLSTLKSKAI